MITSLNVVFPEKCGKIRGFFNRLRGDKVCVEIKRARGVSVKQLTYICRRQKVNLNKIDRAIGNQRTRLLCCEEMTFPNDKILTIELSEQQISGRTISLSVEYEDVLNADSFNKALLYEY